MSKVKQKNRLIIIPLSKVTDIDLEGAKSGRVWVSGLSTMRKLMDYDLDEFDSFTGLNIKYGKKYPLKDKIKAVANILDLLAYVDINRNRQERDRITISVKVIHSFLTNSKKYIDYLKIISEMRLITNIPHEDNTWYIKGAKSKLFYVHEEYVNDHPCLVILKGEKKNMEIDVSADNIPKKFINTIKNIDIDYELAFKAELDYHQKFKTTISSLKCRLAAIFNLTNKNRYISKSEKVHRIFHSLSNLSKVSRQFIYVKGSSFHNIDVKNSQPLILVYYLVKNKMSIDDNYIKNCEDCIFYEQFYDLSKQKIKGKIRDDVKKKIYSSIFFGFNTKSKVNQRFKTLYPLTYSSLEQIVKSKNMTLSGELQRIEADIFNTIIPVESKWYFTLFDALYFTDIEDRVDIETKIFNKFNKLGIRVTTEFS
ncbi:MAG: hypothetical protein CFE21_19980 [Bacteroidetes bacterium B1(2017)]|nr:MAG: hypothetical protein CFE21_19980 [Bacteroidetes bacterium B1(2017)]